MPRRLKTPCRHPGCPRTTRGGWCAEHRRERYVPARRGTTTELGYDGAWRKLRDWYIRQHPLCEDCLEEDIVNCLHLDVDHIIPIRVRPDLRLAATNLRTRCRMHHRRKTERDKQLYGESY